jgi:glycosyltransferase involved in cell wall biosynthesis
MKILLVAPQPFYTERGTPIAVRLLVETLCEFGHQVDLLVYHDGDDIAVPGMRLLRAWRPPGVRQVPIGISWQKLACDALLVLSMIGHLLRNQYDVIHAVEESVFPAAALGLLSKRKLVYDMDSSLAEQLVDKWTPLRPLAALFRWLERAAVRRSAVVLPVCEDLARKVRPWTDAWRVTVLPDVPVGDPSPVGVHESLRDLAGPHSVIGLYVGNLERYQGIDLLVDGLAAMSKDVDLRMVVIGGSPSDVARYRQRAHELGVADRISLLGPRPLAHLNAYLAQADVLVSPRTMGQNTPMKVYSYMQSGKAILATDIRSHTQALDATCAELVPPEPEAVARGLERLARDEPRRRLLGNAARLKAESEYSLDAYRARLRRAYGQLVSG